MVQRFSARQSSLFHAQAFGLELGESEEDSRRFIRHTLWKLEIGLKKNEIRSLGEERLKQRSAQQRREHQRYARLISEVPTLELRAPQGMARGLQRSLAKFLQSKQASGGWQTP